MTSQQIAELVGRRYDNVKRTIKLVVKANVIIQPQIKDEQIQETVGRTRIT